MKLFIYLSLLALVGMNLTFFLLGYDIKYSPLISSLIWIFLLHIQSLSGGKNNVFMYISVVLSLFNIFIANTIQSSLGWSLTFLILMVLILKNINDNKLKDNV
jgi:hypothetical protein